MYIKHKHKHQGKEVTEMFGLGVHLKSERQSFLSQSFLNEQDNKNR